MQSEQDKELNYLTLIDIEMFHRDQLDRHGGQDGYRNRAAIEAAVESPKQTMFGEPLYPDLAAKASVYLFQISESQGFVDGNKADRRRRSRLFSLDQRLRNRCNQRRDL